MKRLSQIFLILLFLGIAFQLANAATVEAVQTRSAAMSKDIPAIVIKPAKYAELKELPVVYLLHGYGGNYSDWDTYAKNIEDAADLYNILIVCPDGNNSWYWDSPVDEQFKFETYVSKELVNWIDSHYKTVKGRHGRGITGLSMGGHGALYLAFRHQDVFGAAGSMSGGVDIRSFPRNWEIAKRLGTYAESPENWEKNTAINMLHLLTPGSLALIIDCGTDDFFYRVNENLHQQLLLRNIPHDYITRPGVHNWPYWVNAINYQLLFMNTYFRSQPKH